MDYRRLSMPWRYKRFERRTIIITASVVTLFVSLVLISVLIARRNRIAPDVWYVTREMWQAKASDEKLRPEVYHPSRLVVIHHTVSSSCHDYESCVTALQNLQNYFLTSKKYDIPYQFVIGNDGRVYEGRALAEEGGHTFGYNSCTIGIGFLGNYHEEGEPNYAEVTPLQVQNTHRLLNHIVQQGYLHEHFYLVGGKDVRITDSPGDHLYSEIQKWPSFDQNQLFRTKNCRAIHAMDMNPSTQ